MKPTFASLPVLAALLLPSCIYYENPVPEMPYTPHQPNPTLTQDAYTAATQAEGTWMVTPPQPIAPNSVIPDPAVGMALPHTAAAPAPAPAPTVTPPKPATTITQAPITMNPPVVNTPKPADTAKPASTAKPAPSNRASAKSLKDITNDGPIPVATPVPGKPGLVYNPLQPDLTISIINPKTHQPYPSGKILKVAGTSFFFYVP